MRELVEFYKGRGRVMRGNHVVAEADYKVGIYQEYSEGFTLDGVYSKIPTLKQIECWLDPSVVLPVGREFLTLIIDDGRKLDFFVVSGNTFRATGAIYQ